MYFKVLRRGQSEKGQVAAADTSVWNRPRYGAVTGSTGVVRLDKRAEAPCLYKKGNFFQLTDNDNFVLAAA